MSVTGLVLVFLMRSIAILIKTKLNFFNIFLGDYFEFGKGESHAWNAVFVFGHWRLIDCTWGAGVDAQGYKEIEEHFFLTDPDEMIFTHFPHDEVIIKIIKK